MKTNKEVHQQMIDMLRLALDAELSGQSIDDACTASLAGRQSPEELMHLISMMTGMTLANLGHSAHTLGVGVSDMLNLMEENANQR